MVCLQTMRGLDDFSRYVIGWKLCGNMRAEDGETLSAIGPRTMVERHARHRFGRIRLRQRQGSAQTQATE